jgi:tRNA(adenine34) deaminase
LLGNYRLPECEVFVTLEPCAMCAMALLHARVKRVVYGARDPKAGAAGSVIDVFANAALNHHTRVEGGLLGEDAGVVLRSFFVEKRERYRQRRAAAAPLVDTDLASEPIPAGESLEIDDKAPR